MNFACPSCHENCCTGFSKRDYMVADNDKNLTGVFIVHCPFCNKKAYVRVEAQILEVHIAPKV